MLGLGLLLCTVVVPPAWAQGRATAAPGAGKGEQQAVQWFNMLDRNGDGRLTRDEVKWAFKLDPRLEQQFNEADANHDGVVTEAEIRALAARRKAERAARKAAAGAAAPGSPSVSGK